MNSPALVPRGPGQDYGVRLIPLLDKMGITVDRMYDIGWTDKVMVDQGQATYIIPKPEPVECMLCAGSGHAEDANVSEVTRQLIARDRHGREKYGKTLDRTDLSFAEWAQHMAEELMDGAGYALAAKREAEQLMAIRNIATVLCDQLAADNGEARLFGGATRANFLKLCHLVGVKTS